MRMAELSATAGVSVPTVKFYLREGLLPAGTRTAANQASYDAAHVARLRLIRALVDVGGLSVTQTRDVLAALDDAQSPLEALGAAQDSLAGSPTLSCADLTWASDRVMPALEQAGWEIVPESPAARDALAIVVAIRDAGHEQLLDALLPRYISLADQIAASDLDAVGQYATPEAVVAAAVVGTVLGAPLLSALRMLAHQSHSEARWGAGAASAESHRGDATRSQDDTVRPMVGVRRPWL